MKERKKSEREDKTERKKENILQHQHFGCAALVPKPPKM